MNLGKIKLIMRKKIDIHKSVRYNKNRKVIKMKNVNITNFRKNIYEMIETTIEYNEPLNITTKKGNAVVLSEEDYNSLIETLYISSIPNMKEEIIKRANDESNEFVNEDEVEW
mgnify:CR=1 FL=1